MDILLRVSQLILLPIYIYIRTYIERNIDDFYIIYNTFMVSCHLILKLFINHIYIKKNYVNCHAWYHEVSFRFFFY